MTRDDTYQLEEIDWLFRKMVRKFVKERDKVAVEGIALPGLLVLNSIARSGEQRLGDLAEQLDLTSGAITALCDKLEGKGFAVRRRMAEDRRTVLLDITEEGRAMLARNANIGRRCMTVLFDGFTERELGEQKEIFRRIAFNLERFAETIMELAERNAEQSKQEAPPDPSASRSTFLSY